MNIKLLGIIFILISCANIFLIKKLKKQKINIQKPLFYYLSKNQLRDFLLLKKKLNSPKQKKEVIAQPPKNPEDDVPDVDIPIFSYTDNHIPIYKN